MSDDRGNKFFDRLEEAKPPNHCGQPLNDLLACPFCGANARITSTTFGDSMTEYYRAECDNGDALDYWDDTEDEARQTWNKRAN